VKVFLSYAVGPWDAPIAARLRAVAAAYDISILLPDRTQHPANGISVDTQTKIRQSDAVIALITRTAQAPLMSLVNNELLTAAQASKPVIALIEQGVPIQGLPDDRIVYFNRSDATAHEHDLINVLNQIRSQQQWKKDLTALGWIASIVLGLVALSQLVTDDK
jgi:hypothetical protein